MTWAEFQQWAWVTYGHRIKGGHSRMDPAWRPIVGLKTANWSGNHANANIGLGPGHNAEYGQVHQRRFAFWLRARYLLANDVLYRWLDRAEHHDTGWLVNDGSGVRWTADPEPEALTLTRRGFVAVKCGL